MAILKRTLNELPTLVVLALTLAGVDQTDYQPAVEFAGAVGAFGTWLLVRSNTDGPVTKAAQRRNVSRTLGYTSEGGHGAPNNLIGLLVVAILLIILLKIAFGGL